MSRKKSRFMVTEDGVACGYERIKSIFGSAIADRKTRILVKMPNKPHVFESESEALKATLRAAKLAGRLQGTLLDDWTRIERFVRRGKFEVILACQQP